MQNYASRLKFLFSYDAATDTTSVEKHLGYNSFGENVEETAPGIVWRMRYTGRFFDIVAQLQDNLRRKYDAAIARWASTDPIGFQAGDANLYRYVGNGPLWQVDPLGMWKQCREKDIYISEGGEDSLASLAQEVSGDFRNWVCIWPIISDSITDSWKQYPVPELCDKANVKNLTASRRKGAPTVGLIPKGSKPKDWHIRNLHELITGGFH